MNGPVNVYMCVSGMEDGVGAESKCYILQKISDHLYGYTPGVVYQVTVSDWFSVEIKYVLDRSICICI